MTSSYLDVPAVSQVLSGSHLTSSYLDVPAVSQVLSGSHVTSSYLDVPAVSQVLSGSHVTLSYLDVPAVSQVYIKSSVVILCSSNMTDDTRGSEILTGILQLPVMTNSSIMAVRSWVNAQICDSIILFDELPDSPVY